MPSIYPRQIMLATLSLVVLLAALILVARHAGGASVARAQEPSPTATRTATATASPTASATAAATATPSGTATATACSGAIRGGQTVTAAGSTTVTLPAGGNFDITAGTGAGDPTFTVCHKESQARVTINTQTCREVGESVPDATGALIIARIVESCRTTAVAGSTAVPGQTPGGIQPPSTGDAGFAR